jgi:hypothetical protein
MTKKPVTLSASLTRKPDPVPAAPPTPAPASERPKLTDTRIPTSLRIEPELLRALKIIALNRRVRVNELLLEGARHVVALYGDNAA